MSPPPFTSVNYLGGKRFGTAIEYREATDTFTQSKIELMKDVYQTKGMLMLVLGLLTLSSVQLCAQGSTAVVFTEMGEKFTLYLNGEKQNEQPVRNLRMDDLNADYYIARIDFADSSLPDFTHKNFFVEDNTINNFMIKLNRKGKYVMRYFPGGEVATPTPAAPAAEPAPVVQTVVVEEEERPQPVQTTKTVTTQTTTTTSNTAPSGTQDDMLGGIKLSMAVDSTGLKLDTGFSTGEMDDPDMGGSITMPGMDIDIQMDGMGIDMDAPMSTEETQTTTTVTTTTTTTHDIPVQQPVAAPVEQEVVVDCGFTDSEFAQLQRTIENKSFDDGKKAIFQQAIRSKCPTSAQVAVLLEEFSFDDSKLELAKYAYSRVADQSNFYLVNEAFSFDSTIEELNDYILKQ